MTHKLIGGQIALFPGLPRFYLLWRLHNTREHKSSENRERSGNIHQVNDVRWAQAGHEGGGATAKTTHWIICSCALPQF